MSSLCGSSAGGPASSPEQEAGEGQGVFSMAPHPGSFHGAMGFHVIYPLVNIQKTMENHHFL